VASVGKKTPEDIAGRFKSCSIIAMGLPELAIAKVYQLYKRQDAANNSVQIMYREFYWCDDS